MLPLAPVAVGNICHHLTAHLARPLGGHFLAHSRSLGEERLIEMP